MAVASTKGKEDGGDQKTQKLQKGSVDEVFAIGLDVDSNSGLVFEWPPEEIPKQSAGTEEAVQSGSAATSATLLASGAQAPMDLEQGEEEMETREVAEVMRPTMEELAMAVACTPTPTPVPIYSLVTSVSQVSLPPIRQ